MAAHEDHRDRARGVPRRQDGWCSGGHEYVHLQADQLSCNVGELRDTLRHAVLDDDVFPVDVPQLAQSLPKGLDEGWRRRSDAQQTDSMDLSQLLRFDAERHDKQARSESKQQFPSRRAARRVHSNTAA